MKPISPRTLRSVTAFGGYVCAFLLATLLPASAHAALAPINYQAFADPYETTANITWTTDSLSSSTVMYGTSPGVYPFASSSAVMTTSHAITLTGLTASTTYYYRVQSSNSGGQTTSAEQTFNTVYNCTYYVDSASGLDTNTGTTAEAPWQTLYKASGGSSGSGIPNSSTVCLRRGSTFTSTLWVGIPGTPRNNVTVRDYGPLNLAMPMIDNSDTIAPGSWTVVGGQANLYQATVQGPANSSTATSTPYGTYSPLSIFINMWECKTAPCTPQGIGGNEKFMSFQSSEANANTNANGYWISGQTGGGTITDPSSFTLFMHPSDGSDPRSNGYTYSFSNRLWGIELNGTNDAVMNIASKKASDNSGNFAQTLDESPVTFTNIQSDQGNKHNIFCTSGCIINNSSFTDEYYASGNPLVGFNGTSPALPSPWTCNNCKVTVGVTASGNSLSVFTSHVGSGGQIPAIWNGGVFKGTNGFSLAGADGAGATTTMNGVTCDTVSGGCIDSVISTTTANNTQVVNGNAMFSIQTGGFSFTVASSSYCGTSGNMIQYSSGGQANVNLTVASSTFYHQNGGSAIYDPTGTGGSIKLFNSIFDGTTASGYLALNIPATSTTPYTGDYNLFFNAQGTNKWVAQLNNGTQLLRNFTSQWLLQSGQDVHSSITGTVAPGGNNISTTTACIIPNYAFTGPSSGSVGSASTNFTVTPNKTFNGTVTFTPSGAGSTGLGPTSLTFNNSAVAQTFSFTPIVPGAITWTPTSWTATTSPSFEDAAALTFTANAAVPGAPGSVTATAGDGQATVSFQGPGSNGGATINWYTIMASPGNASTTVNTTSGTVTGLTDGTPYTFTVTATNSIGTSTASSASSPVTPVVAPVTSNNSNSTPSGQSTSSTGGSSASVQANLRAIYAYNHLACPDSSCSGVSTPSASPSVSLGGVPAGTFVKDLQVGNTGTEAKSLQQFLNTHGYLVTGSGAGSPGHETDLFGGLTKTALMRFQKDHGIPSTGYFGPITRAYIASH